MYQKSLQIKLQNITKTDMNNILNKDIQLVEPGHKYILSNNPDIINTVAKDMDIKTGVLDPLGATIDPGKGLYFDLIRNMSKSFKGC